MTTVVPVRNGELVLTAEGKRSHSRLEQGKSYFRNAGVDDVINAGSGETVFVEIELRDRER
jgi:hypothetical protein